MVAKTNHINHQAGDRPVGRQDLQPTGQPPNQSWIAMQNHRFFFGKTSSFIIELYLGHGFQFATCSSEHVRTRGY
jgi:hypothetical protein